LIDLDQIAAGIVKHGNGRFAGTGWLHGKGHAEVSSSLEFLLYVVDRKSRERDAYQTPFCPPGELSFLVRRLRVLLCRYNIRFLLGR
jgi:hypothetical protein